MCAQESEDGREGDNEKRDDREGNGLLHKAPIIVQMQVQAGPIRKTMDAPFAKILHSPLSPCDRHQI